MCTNIPVRLPTVMSFLLLYSLRCGCVVILAWTAVRALFFLSFFVLALIETYLTRPPPLGEVFPEKPLPPKDEEHYYFGFFGALTMIVTECFVVMFTIYLGMGLYYCTPHRLQQYLICRFCSWVIESAFLVILCLTHDILIGWYLVFLMIVILELYAYIVVYSYYIEMSEEQEEKLGPIGKIRSQSHCNLSKKKPQKPDCPCPV